MEFDLIARIRARAAARGDVVLGIGDDAALLQPPPGMQLAVTMDTLNVGVHFPAATAPADIGWKALAVNLSDLAAMGAQPAWCTLSLSLPGADAGFLDGFLDGFLELAALHGIVLVGGDTTRGPLSVCVTAHGLVEPGRALRRAGAAPGDDVWVTGTPGDAAGALGVRDRVQRDGGLTAGLRTVDLDHPAAGQTAHAERHVERDGAGRDDSRLHDGPLPQPHHRTLAELLVDLSESKVERLLPVRPCCHRCHPCLRRRLS